MIFIGPVVENLKIITAFRSRRVLNLITQRGMTIISVGETSREIRDLGGVVQDQSVTCAVLRSKRDLTRTPGMITTCAKGMILLTSSRGPVLEYREAEAVYNGGRHQTLPHGMITIYAEINLIPICQILSSLQILDGAVLASHRVTTVRGLWKTQIHTHGMIITSAGRQEKSILASGGAWRVV